MQEGVRKRMAAQHIGRGIFARERPFDGPAHIADIELYSLRQRLTRYAVRRRLQTLRKGLPIVALPLRQIFDRAVGAKFGFECLHRRQVIAGERPCMQRGFDLGGVGRKLPILAERVPESGIVALVLQIQIQQRFLSG